MSGAWFGNTQNINSFLGYRYLPDRRWDVPPEVLAATEATTEFSSKRGLVAAGQSALETTFRELTAEDDDRVTHVLPLSGGLDSRTILGGLLANVDRERIVTVTFGTPGTLDYDIGKAVATEAGVENRAYDLSPRSFPWTDKLLLKNAAEYARPTKLFRARSALNYAFDELNAENCVYWSGFMGEASAGAHLPASESESWSAALSHFVDANFGVPQLTADDFGPREVLPDEPFAERSVLSFDEQLDYGIRQPYYIRPAAVFRDGFETPFCSEPWLEFMLNAPRELRLDRALFKTVVREQYPALFSLPTESNGGLPIDAPKYRRWMNIGKSMVENRVKRALGLRTSRHSTNHFDWNAELKHSERLRSLAKRHLLDLADRNVVPWVDIEGIWNDSQSGGTRGDEIHQLVSLELYLKIES